MARLNRECDYSNRKVENDLRARIRELEDALSRGSALDMASFDPPPEIDPRGSSGSTFHHQALFLDSDIHTEIPATEVYESIPIPTLVAHELGGELRQREILLRYFETAHRWMPVISRIRLMRFSEDSRSKQRADYALLLLSMKLVQETPESPMASALTPLYTAAKELSFSLEVASVHSLLRLQANVLLAVYELGHGILPAAYMSVGFSITQSVALGIHDSTAPQMLRSPKNWVEWEERQRVWWLLIVLDRSAKYSPAYHFSALTSVPDMPQSGGTIGPYLRRTQTTPLTYPLMM